MNKRVHSILLTVLAALALLVTSSAVNADELLSNGGFENPLAPPDQVPTDNWSPFSGGPPQPFMDTTMPNTGNGHLNASISMFPNTFVGIQQLEENIQEGEDYEFKLFAKTVGVFDIVAEFRLEWFDANGQIGTSAGDFTGLNDTYQQFSVTAAAPTGAIAARAVFALQSFNGGADGTVFVDDASLHGPTAIPEPGTLGLIALGMVGLVTRRRRS